MCGSDGDDWLFHAVVNGATVAVDLMTPSTYSSMRVTSTLSLTATCTCRFLCWLRWMIQLLAGDVMAMVGAIVSAVELLTVTLRCATAVFPVASRADARIVCKPLATAVVF